MRTTNPRDESCPYCGVRGCDIHTRCLVCSAIFENTDSDHFCSMACLRAYMREHPEWVGPAPSR